MRVYCKNFRPKYEIFTKLQHIVESAPRPNTVSRAVDSCNGLTSLLLSRYLYLDFCLYFYSPIPVWKREWERKVFFSYFESLIYWEYTVKAYFRRKIMERIMVVQVRLKSMAYAQTCNDHRIIRAEKLCICWKKVICNGRVRKSGHSIRSVRFLSPQSTIFSQCLPIIFNVKSMNDLSERIIVFWIKIPK